MGETITLQRRSTKISLSLALCLSFDAFEKHVRSCFQLADETSFVVTDFDREFVIDPGSYGSLRSGDYWRRDPAASRLFVVLDTISAPLEGDLELEVSYQPHYNTITKTGQANFSKVPHAVAELIDNSIQATSSNVGPRVVEVEVELGGGKGSSFLVVRDNGRGMNAKGIKEFATYFLTQENRGVRGPEESAVSQLSSGPSGATGSVGGGAGGGRTSSSGKGRARAKGPRSAGSFGVRKGKICSGFISKYGVGALQAGFYIGSCLTVVTKTATHPHVYEFVMDEAEFERRAATNAAMFTDKIKLRNAGKQPEDPEAERTGPSKELLDRLKAEEIGKRSFTYIVLTLRDKHVEQWFTNHERGSLKSELASIYHYYLHPEHCPDGIRRDDNSSVTSSDSEGEANRIGEEQLEITYKQKNRRGQAETVRLADVDYDLESRLISAKKDSFIFKMDVLHPMKNYREETQYLPVTGVVHYYPYDGERETRPHLWLDEEDDDSTTVEVFWEGRLVPDSHASALSFFPEAKPKKKDRDELGANWKRRIKAMLFFDWHFPISNNKLRLQFPEGDLQSALTAKNILPKPPAVKYTERARGRVIEKDFREWLIHCHKTYDREYRCEDKMQPPPNAKRDIWRKITFGKGEATFKSNDRVKLPNRKPQVHGVINYFFTAVDEDVEAGRHQAKFSLRRWPEDVFGASDSDANVYPVTELDPLKSKISTEDWLKETAKYKKQMPASTNILMTASKKKLPKRLNIRTGKQEATKLSVQILDGYKKSTVTHPNGKALRVISVLERPHENGTLEYVLGIVAKPYADKNYPDQYCFDSINIKEPGDYTWTVAVATEGVEPEQMNLFMLKAQCAITVLPGNPTKMSLEADFDTKVPLENPCWLPALTVKLRDASKCICPIQAYKSVSIKCLEEGAMDVLYKDAAGSGTHDMERVMSEDHGPLTYDEHSWEIVPTARGILSGTAFVDRQIEFEMTVIAHLQQDKPDARNSKEFKSTFKITFEPGAPAELVLLNPDMHSDGSSLGVTEAGTRLPPLSLGALDAAGNRTAPAPTETWTVSLDITSAEVSENEQPEFVGSAEAAVSGTAATFSPPPVVKWDKVLNNGGEMAVVEAVLSTGKKSEAVSGSFSVKISPSTRPIEVLVCKDGRPWPAQGKGMVFDAGSVITGLHMRLLDQGGNEVVIGKDTFGSTKETVTCTWNASWRWSAKNCAKAGGFDRLPDLQVPTQLSMLDQGGVSHAKLTILPKGGTGALSTNFSFVVRAGAVDRWMAVRADTGKPSDSVGTLVAVAGLDDPKALQASFAKVVKGFLPVDEFGNLIKNVPRAPVLRIAGMPNTKLVPHPNPAPPDENGAGAGGASPAARGRKSNGAGSQGYSGSRRELRLAVSMRPGPPKKVMIRSALMGSPEFSSEIRATLLAGFKVSDLEVSIVDAAGNPCLLDKPGIVTVALAQEPAVASSSRAARRPDSVSRVSTSEPAVVMPQFTLLQKRAIDRGHFSKADMAATRTARDVVALAVRMEGEGFGRVEEACILWKRVRTSAVTQVHLCAVKPAQEGNAEALEQAEPLPVRLGGKRQDGICRPVDGPLPSLIVWLDTDNGTPFTPSAESLTLVITASGSSGPRSLMNAYKAPAVAPMALGHPNALVFRPRSASPMEHDVGDHIITCSYATSVMQGSQEETEERAVELPLRVVPGAPRKLAPVAEDGHLLHSLSASNQAPFSAHPSDVEDARKARKLVAETFRFTAHDIKGNEVANITGRVRMRIETLKGESVPQNQMPRLEDAFGDGYAYAEPTQTGVFLFQEKWLQASVGTQEGDYRLVVDSEGDPHLEEWSTRFRFETDERRLDLIRDVKAQLKPLQEQMDAYQAKCHSAEQKEALATQEVRKVVQTLPEGLATLLGLENDLTACLPTAREMSQNLRKEQADRNSHVARPAKFLEGRLNPLVEARINPIGYLVQLGFVDDEEKAKLLSQKAGPKMKSVFVRTVAQLCDVRNAQASAFCEETVSTFTMQGRPRSEKQIAAKSLPLRPVTDKGCEGYLVNMIQLPDDQEHLRDTIFHAVYGTTVMFDTLENAANYQARCKERRQLPLPILVKEDGTVLERSGYMAANRGAETLQHLKHVYGAMPETSKPEYAKTEKYIKGLQYLVPLLEDLESASQATKDVREGSAAAAWQADIDALQEKLEGLIGRPNRMSTPTRVAGGGSKGTAGGGGSSSAGTRSGRESSRKKLRGATSSGPPAKKSRRW